MTDSKPITLVNIDCGGLSDAAKTLVEKVSDAIGTIYEPMRIVRLAKAESEARRIEALADIEIDDIQRRGLVRMIEQEGKKQRNIESIVKLAIDNLPSDSRPEEINPDWISYFFNCCDSVSEIDMQTLWARILSEEASNPHTFSKRTLSFLTSLEKFEAELFTDLCQFVWSISGRDNGQDQVLTIFHYDDEIFKNENINFASLLHLESIGLITLDYDEYIEVSLPKNVTFEYFGKPYHGEFSKPKDNEIGVGIARFTKIGSELRSICGAKPNPEFYEYGRKKFIKFGAIPRISPATAELELD